MQLSPLGPNLSRAGQTTSMVQLVSWLRAVKGFYAQCLQIQIQQQTTSQLTYAYSSCFWLLGVRQLAGNLHEFCCISVKVFIFGLIPDFQKANINLVMSVFLSLSQSVRNKSAATGRTLWSLYSKNFRKYVEKFSVWIKFDKIKGNLHEDYVKLWYLSELFLEAEMYQINIYNKHQCSV